MRSLFAITAALALSASHPAAGSRPCNAPPLLAMTYNIRLDTPADGENAWAHRKAFFIGQIAVVRPDLLGLQEVLINQRKDLAAALPDYELTGGGRDDGKEAGEASPLAINRRSFNILASGMFWLSPTPNRPSLGWDAGYRRVVTWAHLRRKSDGLRLLAINTHWDHQGLEARRQSSRQVLGWIKAHLGKDERLVLLGDFNAELSEDSLVLLTAPDPGGTSLRDARTEAGALRFGPSFSFNGFKTESSGGKLIDHIFVGPSVKVLTHGVLAAQQDGRVASDHFPVVALLDPQGEALTARCGQSPRR